MCRGGYDPPLQERDDCFMWWKTQDKKTLLTGAIICSVAAVAALLNVLNNHDVWWVLITILFTLNAVIRWFSCAKKRQEKTDRE